MDEATTNRPADLEPVSRWGGRTGVVAVLCVVTAGMLRLIAPLAQYARSGWRDTFELWVALAVPLAMLVIIGVLVAIRISPWRRQRRLREAHSDAVVTTGQWVDETRAAMPGAPTGGQMRTYTLVIDRVGIIFYSGPARATSRVAVPAGEILWVHTAMERMWQRSRATLVVTTTTGTLPLLLVDFSRPISFFMAPNSPH